MQMPLMVDITKAVVFAGERGEGLQKTQKLSVYADDLLVVCEGEPKMREIVVPAGRLSEVKEALYLKAERRIPVHHVSASALYRADGEAGIESIIHGASFVVSDLENEELNGAIFKTCRRLGILCTVVDTKPLCSAWFMSLVETDNLLAAISSKGRCAFLSARIREELQEDFDQREPLASVMVELRTDLRTRYPVPQLIKALDAVYADKGVRRLAGRARDRAMQRARRILKNKGYV